MERPFVVCHMLTSLDGKIDGAFFGAPETAPALRAYADLRGFYACQATLYGTTTMRGGYADGDAPALPAARGEVPAEWINPEGRKMGNFILSLDPRGELGFSSHVLEKKGRPAAHVVEALTGQAAPAYRAYLREVGVSYLTVGRERLDCAALLQALREKFGIARLMAAGGGVTNWSLLREGLVDELSLVIAPVADGSTTAASIFAQAPFLPPHGPVPFALKEAKPLEGGVESALLNLGGNVQAIGARPDGSPWRLELCNPFGEGGLGLLLAQDCAVITSGNYENCFVAEDGTVYGHILDPETGRPADSGLASVTIVAQEGRLGDALSTSLFVMGAQRAEAFWRERGDFDMILVTQAGEILVTEGIAESFTPYEDQAAVRVLTREVRADAGHFSQENLE